MTEGRTNLVERAAEVVLDLLAWPDQSAVLAQEPKRLQKERA